MLDEIEYREREMAAERAELEHDAFLAERAGGFYLFGDIDADSAEKLIREMELWFIAYGHRHEAMCLFLNSEGGELAAGLAIHDTLRSYSALGLHVSVGVRGEACSMAAVVLQAGDSRIIGPASRLMLHQVSSGGAGTTAEIHRQAAHLRETDKAIAELFAKRSGKFSVEWLEKEILDRDRWFTPAEALEVGLVDSIA
jgi:ATP-dependent Clp protease protease subunit